MNEATEIKKALETEILLNLRAKKNVNVYQIGTDEVPDLELSEDDLFSHGGAIVVERKGKPDSRVFVHVDYELF